MGAAICPKPLNHGAPLEGGIPISGGQSVTRGAGEVVSTPQGGSAVPNTQ